MVAKRKKKFQSGEGARYISRNKALKYLQLSLKDFRRLCILKGVYPREPKNRKKAQKGEPGIQTLYARKDIQFLLHEPNIWKLREVKTLFKRIRRAKTIRETDDLKRLREKYPEIKLDHIVKERYPTFIDALRDLDDCLTLLFLFATFPALNLVPVKVSTMCRRLTVEFMNYVIAAQALRKVFISIKGYYYQAEIKGQNVTWIIPHHFSFEPQKKSEVDFSVMSIFVDFYLIMLGFVNFRLYHTLNLVYPPTFAASPVTKEDTQLVDPQVYRSECIAALNVDLVRTGNEIEEEGIDEFPLIEEESKMEEARKQIEKVKNLKVLFKGLKFFVNREVPREPIVFVIRCFGGEVSWDKLHNIGATYDENDETITHQIVDRPSLEKQYQSRYYVQPQWLFDSVNSCELLPVQRYLLGAVLPPHLSPFHEEHKLDNYVPPEEKALEDPEMAKKLAAQEEESESSDEETDEEIEEGSESEMVGNNSEDELDETTEIDEEEKERLKRKKKMKVTSGVLTREDPDAARLLERQEFKLREKMVRNKHRKLYKSMVAGRRERSREAWLLAKKRTRIEAEEKQKRKQEKRQKKEKNIFGDSQPSTSTA